MSEVSIHTDVFIHHFIHRELDALSDRHGYCNCHWTADELAIDLAMFSAALDGCDPKHLEPACEARLRQRWAA